jgi:hypothetical protein
MPGKAGTWPSETDENITSPKDCHNPTKQLKPKPRSIETENTSGFSERVKG